LGLQIALVVATALTGLWADSQAIYAAAWHMLGGLPIWVILLLIFQQHESERAQRLAADKLSESTKAATIFDGLGDDLDAAKARLDRLYRYGLPAVSLLVAFYLLSAGVGLLYVQLRGRAAAATAPQLAAGCSPVGLMFVTAAIAFTAFVAARWISGYTRQRAWQLLRGCGAAF